MGNPKKTPPFAVADAKAAFTKLRTRLEQLDAASVEAVNTVLDAAAITAYGVAQILNEPPMRKRFAGLPATEYDIKNLDDLESAALATWYASTELLSANAQGTEAKIPLALANEAAAHKATMLKVCAYHFDDDSPQGRETASIRLGTGYRDLAQDLRRLAKLYTENAATLAHDAVHYHADDAKKADVLCQRILHELSASRTTEQERWLDRTARAWTLLRFLYNDSTSTATWLQRNEAGAAGYPSLVTAGRSPRKARNESAPDSPDAAAPDADARANPSETDSTTPKENG